MAAAGLLAGQVLAGIAGAALLTAMVRYRQQIRWAVVRCAQRREKGKKQSGLVAPRPLKVAAPLSVHAAL
jgi:hypothetical protein